MGKAAVPSRAVIKKEGLPSYIQAHSWLGCAEVIQLLVEPVLEVSLFWWVPTRTAFFCVQTQTC